MLFILLGEIFMQSQWYHRVQDVHCTIFRPSSGNLHVQYTDSLARSNPCLLLGALIEGNRRRSLSSRHFSRWALIWLWSNRTFFGFCPLQIAVADTIAKSPQSEPPLCNCMGARWMVIVGLSVCTRFAMVHLMDVVSPKFRLSYTLTTPGTHPTVDTIIQWLSARLRHWTKFFVDVYSWVHLWSVPLLMIIVQQKDHYITHTCG